MNVFSDSEIDLSPELVARRLQLGELVLVDVREGYEWDAGRVPGSHHIEIEYVASRAPQIPRDQAVAFMCLGGIRSAMVARAFRAAGYEAYNVAGGFREWVAAGLPVEPEGFTIAPH